LETKAIDAEFFHVKAFVQKVCDEAGYRTDDANVIKLAVEEVFTNIGHHAYEGRRDGAVTLELGVGPGDLEIKLTDHGRSFDFESIKDPDLSQYIEIGKRGGLGILFLRKIMRRVSYRSSPGKNEWVLFYHVARGRSRGLEGTFRAEGLPGSPVPSGTDIEQERLRREVKIAQQIQHALLPKEFPTIEGYEIGATYRAASEVGGDYYDFFWVGPTSLGIAVGDVSGKGVPGSMVMAMIRSVMRLEARKNRSASKVLVKVNEHVTGDMKTGMFVTMFYIILDSLKRSINFASAGHNPMILYRGSSDEVYFLKPKGFPLGIDLPEDNMFAKTLALQKVDLQKDDMLVLYTDGVTEAMNAKKEQFGEERLVKVIRENARLTASQFVEKLKENLADFIQGAPQSDDITVVAIKENMGVEDVLFHYRRKLIESVVAEGRSVSEACRESGFSRKEFNRLKKLYDKKGIEGLRPETPSKRSMMSELSVPQKQAVMAVVRSEPDLDAKRIVEFLRKKNEPPVLVDPKVVKDYLERKGLGSAKERKTFAANAIDTI
jgi:anti-sigma regulatory factor (Ser/Thr protein kinase)/transposase